MTKRFKDNPRLSNSDKKIKVIDTKSGEATFVTKEEILGSLDRYKPISGPKNFEAQFSKQKENKTKGSPFINEVQKIMEEREPNGRRSNTDIRLAEKKLKMSKGGRIGLKMGSKCKLAKRGKGRAYGKNS